MDNIIIEKIFEVPFWNETQKERAIGYWRRKRFKFTQTSLNALRAKRGRWLGNMISSDLTYIKAELSIEITVNTMSCVMETNPRLQKVTEWDMTWWNLEMKTFESFLLFNDEQRELWRQFKRDHKNVILSWSLAGGRDGTLLEMFPEDRQRYQ